ncbi:MAG: hypothetical protein M0R17_09515 [Candidatus Omnitrophica bacterium]|jgi:hypothetical protein|nr:hypothetical protein [Candidatus Omnitrophota bacterium]
MINQEERPVTVAVHPRLIEELKKRKEQIELETGRKMWGGLTKSSEMASMELKEIRKSGDDLMKDILKECNYKELPIKKIVEGNIEKEYVPYEIFKKLHRMVAVLSKKKDQTQIQLEVTKMRGIKKNEIICFWK